MAQQQQNVAIQAPGFQGLNTEDSPLTQDPGYATLADNCVIDQLGRVGSRKAFKTRTTSDNVMYFSNINTERDVREVHQLQCGCINDQKFVLGTASQIEYDAADNMIAEHYFIVRFDGVNMDALAYPTLASPSALTNASIVYFNDRFYVFSKGNDALVYDGTSITKLFSGTSDTDFIYPQDDTGTLSTSLDGDVALSAYGRLWVSGVNGDYNTIFYSDLLIGTQWFDGRTTPADAQNTGGIIDVSEFWPSGGDRIVAIEAHNNFLIVFGRQSILLYSNAQSGDPAAADGIALQDAVSNLGAVSRDGVVNIGSDVLFVDDSGVRSLGRTIQEKSVPIGDLTRNVRSDISDLIRTERKDAISLAYLPDNNIAVCQFADTKQAYVMDMRNPSSTGGLKVTRWTNTSFNRMLYVEYGDTAETLFSSRDGQGLLVYEDYLEWDSEPYLMKYQSNVFTFGSTVTQKFVKRVDFLLISTFINAPAVVRWGYDGLLKYTANKTIEAQRPALFGVSYYNQGETYGEGLETVRRYRVNTKGSGSLVSVGLEVEISGNSLSVQEINIQTLLGRIY